MRFANAEVTAQIPATNLERAKEFYEDKLGLRFIETVISDSLTFEAGRGCRIFLYKRGATKADHSVASFRVEEVLSAVNELKSRGVVFEAYDITIEGTGERIKTDENNIAHFGSAQAAWFKDSEGNILSIADH